MSSIRLRHMSLTYPQTPINRSIPRHFYAPRHLGIDTKTSQERSWKTPKHLEHKQHQIRFKSTKTLLESSPKASRNFKNFNFKYEEHSKRNLPNHLPRSQRSLESSSKASKNFKKLQIGEALWIQASKSSKNFSRKPSNTKNIQREIIQIIFLISKFTVIKLKSLQKLQETINQ